MAGGEAKDAMKRLMSGAKTTSKAPAAKSAPAKKRAAPKAAAPAQPQAKRAKATTAYFVFTEENRKAVRDELVAQMSAEQEPAADGAPLPTPKVAVPLVAKALGQKWKALSDEERQHYKELAAQKAQQAAEAAAAEQAQETCTAAAADKHADAAASPTAGSPDATGQRDQQHPASTPAAKRHCGENEAAEAGPSGPPAALPKGVVKRLMMCDPDVTRASADAVYLVARAAEQLLEGLALKCAAAAEAKKRRTIQLGDFERVIRYDRRLVEAGMKDIVDDKDMFAAAASKDQDAAAAAGTKAAERAVAKQEAAVASIHKITTFFVAKPAEVEC